MSNINPEFIEKLGRNLQNTQSPNRKLRQPGYTTHTPPNYPLPMANAQNEPKRTKTKKHSREIPFRARNKEWFRSYVIKSLRKRSIKSISTIRRCYLLQKLPTALLRQRSCVAPLFPPFFFAMSRNIAKPVKLAILPPLDLLSSLVTIATII